MNDIDATYTGRPFGGVAIITKGIPNVTVLEINVASDRICAVGLYDECGNIIHVVASVYMPFYNSSKVKTEEYMETMDHLQSLLDQYAPVAPVKICGDFNAQLPHMNKLSPTWYKGRGFNTHSNILYNFITGNVLTVTDMYYSQSIKYTYFCHARNVHTWIDHILATDMETSNMKSCKIMDHDSGNVSDHLPLQLVTTINLC